MGGFKILVIITSGVYTDYEFHLVKINDYYALVVQTTHAQWNLRKKLSKLDHSISYLYVTYF